jgi:rsbT co-antagonist protein RsbR
MREVVAALRRRASGLGQLPTRKGQRMASSTTSRIPEIVEKYEREVLAEWVNHQLGAVTLRRDLLKDDELREQSRRFLALFTEALRKSRDGVDTQGTAWADAREFLAEVSQRRARQGFSPSDTATFVFSLKQPLFDRLRRELESSPAVLTEAVWQSSMLLDRLGLYTTECFQRGREEVIARQQQEMLELSTPVVQLWAGILALPLIGTLDSARTQIVMESLLQKIVETGAGIAIIDITGVPTVDTLVAQHLLKTVGAARLMGAECIISGIRPQIAQTIVHLGVDLADVVTKATLADAFAIALKRAGLAIGPAANGA